MADYYVDVPTINDRDVFRFFREVAQILGAPHFSLTPRGGQSIEIRTDQEDAETYLSSSTLYSVYAARTTITGFLVSLAREHSGNKELHFDKLRLHRADNHTAVSDDTLFKINQLISDTFYPSTISSSALFSNPALFESLIKSHQELLVRLESSATRITESMVAARLRLEEEFSQRQSALEESFQKRQIQSDAILDEAKLSLTKREEELEQRQKELDDRDHIHARRQLREQITSGIAARLEGAIIPARTSTVGFVVFMLAISGSIALGAISFLSFQEFASILQAAAKATGPIKHESDYVALAQAQSPAVWFLLARGFLASLGAIAFLIYAISWLKNIYNDRLRAHRELERYSIDLNRASWAVETIMEAKSSGGTIPDILVAGVSRNLFDSSTEKSQGNSTGDALGSLLRASARAKIGPSGAEFEMNGRGAKKLADRLDD